MNANIAFLVTVSLWLVLLPSPSVCQEVIASTVSSIITASMYDALPNKFWNFCFLPEQPEGGRYELDDCTKPCDKSPNDSVPRNSTLIYSCENNYILNGNAISVCINQKWSLSPSCLKVCPPLRSTSEDISCSYQDETVSCTKNVLPGTKARLACKPFYTLPITTDPGYREITCLDDGTWDNHIFRCLPECGTSIARGQPLIVNGYEAKVGIFPWHVGIYAKLQSDKYEQTCGGTLISNNLIISAAHCFYDEVFNQISDASNYAVGAGKYFRDWNARDDLAQKSLIGSIQLGERYIGLRGNYADDIALVKLQTPFQLTILVRPVCMDWDNQYEREQLDVQQSGKIVGWGKDINGESTKNLHEIDMPFVPYHQCRSEVPRDFKGYITSDKFCAGHLNGSSVCEGDNGGGICFEKNGVWYIRGVASVSPVRNGSCDNNSYAAFTSVSNSLHWIRQAYANTLREVIRPEALQTVSFNRANTYVENANENRLSNSRDCILPEQSEGGHYELIGCAESCSKLPNDLVSEISVLSYTCKHNYILSGNTFSICINQKWTTPPSCLKICSPLSSTSVDISCSYQDETVSCTKNVLLGTKATLACKPFYTLPLTGGSAYREITCLDDGTWDNYNFHCLPECGISIVRRIVRQYPKLAVIGGSKTKVGIFPWHVGIYAKLQSDKYEQICGGTLISNNLVISAAHCFYDEVFNKINDASNYAVGAGKNFRDWNAIYDYAQKSLVESIRSGERYIGLRGNFADDIALVKLQTSFQLTTSVRPVCMDWDNRYEREQLNVEQFGKIVGWGKDINGESTKNLHEIYMPFVPYHQCRSKVPRDFEGYITLDKFCAGHLNGSSVCDGDSGGGICFEKDYVWYIRGVVSVSPVRNGSCDYNTYVAFTSVSNSRHWIREVVENETRSRVCILPEQPENGHYELIGCAEPCSELPNGLVLENSVLSYTCKHNYILSGNTFSICINQKWTTPPSCLKNCSPLRSTSEDISCSYQNETVSCTKNVLPGTKATLACKPFYTLPLTGGSAYREITCLNNGTWDNYIFPCLPECGKNYAHGNTLNGLHTKVEVFPWHVGIYFKRNTSEYELRCDGTLIKSNLVISAAHCFYDEIFGKVRDASNFAVGAGKYYRDWDAKEDYAQKSSVENIQIGDRFLGSRDNYRNDIALLKLKKSFQLTILVRPVCIDWSNQYEREQLQEGQAGKIVNWHRDVNRKFTNKSQEFNMLYVPYQQCLSALPRDVHNRLTVDRFCARRLNGSNVCEENGGSGLCFKTNGIWYLRGVASVSLSPYLEERDTCNYLLYFGFTYVSRYRNWIRETYIKMMMSNKIVF